MVIALDKHKRPMGFVTERRARKLMERRRAVLYRTFPTVIIVKDKDARTLGELPSYRIKIDPGACYTGIAIVCNETNEAMLYMQIHHRGSFVKKALDTRRAVRRNRRGRETCYRRCKFAKPGAYASPRPDGWLPPSICSVAGNVDSWVNRLRRLINITKCSYEAVRFDTQLMESPNIDGVEYQHGTLYGYEIKEYLLEKYGHTCQYCGGASGDGVLEWEHMLPKSRGGSDSVKNACLACHTCNQDKGDKTLKEYLKELKQRSPVSKNGQLLNDARIQHISNVIEGKPAAKRLRYAAWAGAMRRYVEKRLFATFGDVECSSGGRTKYNRTELKLPKDHHYDALCVGEVPEGGFIDRTGGYVLHATAMGRGTRFRGKINGCGIITKKLGPRSKRVHGFMNGDIVRADVPSGKYAGIHVGRVMTRASGSFDIRCTTGELATTSYKWCRVLQHDNGFRFEYAK